ncbi:unnamed protein product [Spirodela intermedia]|uniref:Uncharacterized protein n=2 Tax=Spirodela intermedia TaxID=51605 RepID=A0A7I8K723_SPIIN|nr:unnamed protein product [Spirodela intermedia]CAA6657404.1 unnamed protein product [Spirodela intermedia]CAA7393463.1 unnamed protein product [Spirodela intermedia]
MKRRAREGKKAERRRRRCRRRWDVSEDEAVSQRLRALSELMPSCGGGNAAAVADRLFEETANYIIRLRTCVDTLRVLVELYGSPGR